MKIVALKFSLAFYFLALMAVFVFFPNEDFIHYFYTGTILFAFWGGLYALRNTGIRGEGMSVLYIATGISFWTVGEVLFLYYNVILDVYPFPSWADVFFVAAYIPLVIGFIREVINKQVDLRAHFQWYKIILAGVIVFFLAYQVIFQLRDSSLSLLTKVADIAYGIGDVVLLICAMTLLSVVSEYKSGKFGKIWRGFFFGVFLIFIADIFYIVFPDQYVAKEVPYIFIDVLYGAGYLFFAYSLVYMGMTIASVRKKIN